MKLFVPRYCMSLSLEGLVHVAQRVRRKSLKNTHALQLYTIKSVDT